MFTWGLMLALVAGSMLVTRRLSRDLHRSRWQNLLEIIVTAIEKQIEEVGLSQPQKYLGFLGTIFLFVATASLCTIFRACAESLASENASRLAAMERADRNIDELLADLNGTFHRLRQSSIDAELFDVISGSALQGAR